MAQQQQPQQRQLKTSCKKTLHSNREQSISRGSAEMERERRQGKSFVSFSHKNDTKFKFHFINNLKRSMKRQRVLPLTSLASLMEICEQLQLIKASPIADSESSSCCWAFIYFKVKMMWAGCGWLQHQSRLQSIWEVTQILREAALAARCLAACGNWGRNFSSSSSRSRSNNNNSQQQHQPLPLGSQLKGPSVGFSHVRYVNGIRKVFKQEPSWMYIYLNTHIHKYTHKSMCVCVWFW